MSPFNAFLFLQGLETLSLRMARHVENAAAVASYLESHELASNVTYPGLRTSRYRPLVDKYLPRGAGAVFSFDCRGGRAAGQDFIRGVTPVVAPRERRRFEEPHHPSGQHDASAAQRRRAARGRRGAGHHPALGRHRSRRRSDLGPRTGLRADGGVGGSRGGISMSQPFDLSRYQDPLTIQRVLHTAKTDRDRRAVEERAARELFRRVLPQAARLPRHSGQPSRGGDPRGEELQQPRRRAGSRRHRQRLPRAGRAARDRQRGGRHRRQDSLVSVHGDQRGRRRGSRRPAVCRSSWIGASRSNTPAM